MSLIYQDWTGKQFLIDTPTDGTTSSLAAVARAWSPSSLAYVNLTVDASGNLNVVGAGGGGGAITIANGADTAEGSIGDAVYIGGSGTVISLLKGIFNQYTTEMDYDVNGNVIYYGIAQPGTGVGSALWQIRKLDYDGSGNLLDVLYAGGSRSFTNVWTNRLALSYS